VLRGGRLLRELADEAHAVVAAKTAPQRWGLWFRGWRFRGCGRVFEVRNFWF